MRREREREFIRVSWNLPFRNYTVRVDSEKSRRFFGDEYI